MRRMIKEGAEQLVIFGICIVIAYVLIFSPINVTTPIHQYGDLVVTKWLYPNSLCSMLDTGLGNAPEKELRCVFSPPLEKGTAKARMQSMGGLLVEIALMIGLLFTPFPFIAGAYAFRISMEIFFQTGTASSLGTMSLGAQGMVALLLLIFAFLCVDMQYLWNDRYYKHHIKWFRKPRL